MPEAGDDAVKNGNAKNTETNMENTLALSLSSSAREPLENKSQSLNRNKARRRDNPIKSELENSGAG